MTVTYTPPPVVSSINRASTNPAYADDTVSWTVVFSVAVTGVDATDFALVPGGSLSGASITSVTGSGTTWTVIANPGGTGPGTLGLNLVDNDSIVNGGTPLGGAGAGNGNFTGQVYTITAAFCSPPAGAPADVTCVCDRFGRASLNPSTIYGANWIVSKSDATAVVPYINATTGNLRLTENTGNNAKAATVPGIFPAAGNYISVEFQHFAYGGNGADGIAVTLSDYSVTAVPGAFGGSLGYAQKTPPAVAANVPGFAGGWIGVGIDEFGNYQNPTEGRIGGPTPAGARVDSVGVRGSGSGVNGYNWIAGTNTLNPQIDNTASATPAPGYYYQVIVDARNDPASTTVTVNRDTGGGYAQLINIPNVYTAANAQGFTQAPVPDNWQISFTGSTGGSTNVHEIGGLRVCASTVAPPSGGTASGFNAIDESYGTPPSGPAVQSFLNGHLYMKVTGIPFKLNVAALNNNQILTTYAAGGNKNVTVKLVDNSDGGCIIDSTQLNYCSAACQAKTAVAGGSQTMTFVAGDSGKKQSANFTLNSAYRNLIAIMSDGTTTACSTDAFSVRPASVASVSSTANNSTDVNTPKFKAGADSFSLTATTTGIALNPSNYTGVLKINNAAVQAVGTATVSGTVSPTTFSAATSGTPSSTATGATFTYSEVGAFRFRGYNPSSDATSPRGIYDGVATATECAPPVTAAQCDNFRAATWVGIDSITSKGDCVQNNYSNTTDANGKYGCSFGIIADTNTGAGNGGFGRFTPFDFNVAYNAPALGTGCGTFTYVGQTFSFGTAPVITVTARNAAGAPTLNYADALMKLSNVSGTSLNQAPYNTQSGRYVRFDALGAGTTPALDTNLLPATTADPTISAFANGVGSLTFAPGGGFAFARSTPSAPFNADIALRLNIIDADGVAYAGNPASFGSITAAGSGIAFSGGKEIRYGRLSIQNAFGSELLDLAMPMRVQYYGANGWVTNINDACTTATIAPLSYVAGGTIGAGDTCVQDNGVGTGLSTQGCVAAGPVAERFKTSPAAGDFNLYLRTPTGAHTGSVDVTGDPGAASWLKFDWDGNAGTAETGPSGRATFGIYKGSPRHIYLRERY